MIIGVHLMMMAMPLMTSRDGLKLIMMPLMIITRVACLAAWLNVFFLGPLFLCPELISPRPSSPVDLFAAFSKLYLMKRSFLSPSPVLATYYTNSIHNTKYGSAIAAASLPWSVCASSWSLTNMSLSALSASSISWSGHLRSLVVPCLPEHPSHCCHVDRCGRQVLCYVFQAFLHLLLHPGLVSLVSPPRSSAAPLRRERLPFLGAASPTPL